jgi:hypothetical protein
MKEVVQHGERMATWALRTCLLRGVSDLDVFKTMEWKYHMVADVFENMQVQNV